MKNESNKLYKSITKSDHIALHKLLSMYNEIMP